MAKDRRAGAKKQDRDLRAAGYFLLAFGAVAHVMLIYHFNFTQDDAFISFRYAANYLNDHGLVYNVGERVEGYTNFLWTILMILGRLAGIDFVIFSRVFGTVCGLGTIALTFRLGQRIFEEMPPATRNFLAGLAALILGVTLSFAYWGVAGLETAAFTLMVTASLYAYLRRSQLIIPALVMATLLRPEGGLVFLFIVTADTIFHRSATRYLVTAALGYVAFLLPFVVFRYAYYHSLLPNPFYAKTSFGVHQIVNGLQYTGQFFWHYLAAGLLILPAVVMLRRASPMMRVIAAFLLTYTIYIILIGGDVLKVHRFFVPLLPLLAPVVVYGLWMMTKKRILFALSLVALVAWQSVIPYPHVMAFLNQEKGFASKMNRFMASLLSADRSDFSLAVSTIGLVGYRLLDHTVIDLLGLTDSTIARHPEPAVAGMETTWRENKHNSAYVLSRAPDYILFSTGIKPSAPAERALFLYSRFLRAYRTVPFYQSGRVHQIYKRYLPITPPVERDVSPEMVRLYYDGIDQWAKKDFRTALASLEKAKTYSPTPVYPYLNYIIALCDQALQDAPGFYRAISQIVAQDTLVIEALEGMYYIEKGIGRPDVARQYRERIARLAPWYSVADGDDSPGK